MKAQLTLVLLVAGLASCNISKGAPSVDVKLDFLTQYNLRGAVQNEKPVVQPYASVRVPLGADTGVGAAFWANADIYDDTGDSVFPDGNGKSFSEIDTSATYYQHAGGVEYAIGAVNYAFPTKTRPTPSRTDAFASAQWEASGWGNAFAAYYSLNDFGGLYLRADFSRGWTINRSTRFDLGMGIGYSDSDNSQLYYGVSADGLADLSLTGSLGYTFDKRTSGALYVTAIQVTESDLEDSLEAQGIEATNVLAGVSMSWSY